MKKIQVIVHQTHLEGLTKTQPIVSVTELVWNALDADATKVHVDVEWGGLDATSVEGLTVRDNGLGMEYGATTKAFSLLGGSEKRHQDRTEGGRPIHGRYGRGRFRALGLGANVTWRTTYQGANGPMSYEVRGSRNNPGAFEVEEPVLTPDRAPGTTVSITGIHKNHRSLQPEEAVMTLSEIFGLHLTQFPDIEIYYGSIQLNPAKFQIYVKDFPDLKGVRVSLDGIERWIQPSLTVIEWRMKVKRQIVLCDGAGIGLEPVPAEVRAPGHEFTAYLKASHFAQIDPLLEMDPAVAPVLGAARAELQEHFDHLAAQADAMRLQEWKKEKVWPYEGDPDSVVEKTEREVFEIVALNVDRYLPDFRTSSKENRKFTLRLLKSALEAGPSDLTLVLQQVLNLPPDSLEELTGLLKRTTLSSIIAASKSVADRLEFLQGLQRLVYDYKADVLERSQLHRILAERTWIFGEQFNLTVDDERLDRVLKVHLEMRGDIDTLEVLSAGKVLRADGTTGVVDLMLSRRVPHPDDLREHLVIELKRPSANLSRKVMDQIEDYAMAVAQDERFRDSNTRWIFWAIGNVMDEPVKIKCRQPGRARGVYNESDEYRFVIWAKTWGEIIHECESRLRFFSEQLQYAATRDSGLEFLRRAHAKYLPDSMQSDVSTAL